MGVWVPINVCFVSLIPCKNYENDNKNKKKREKKELITQLSLE